MKLRELRDKLSLSQKDLADKSGVATSNISKIETGKQRAKYSTRRKLAQALGVDPCSIEW